MHSLLSGIYCLNHAWFSSCLNVHISVCRISTSLASIVTLLLHSAARMINKTTFLNTCTNHAFTLYPAKRKPKQNLKKKKEHWHIIPLQGCTCNKAETKFINKTWIASKKELISLSTLILFITSPLFIYSDVNGRTVWWNPGVDIFRWQRTYMKLKKWQTTRFHSLVQRNVALEQKFYC